MTSWLATGAALLLSAGQLFGQGRTAALSEGDRNLYARIIAMADGRTLDTSLVDQGLVSASGTVRAAAALAIGHVGRDAARIRMDRLRGVLYDPDPHVATRAAYALGLLRDTASVYELDRARRDPNVATEAAWALGQIGEPARAAIVESLASGAGYSPYVIQLLLAAAKLRPVPVASVTPLLHDCEPSIVWAAAYAIARPRASAGLRALIALDEMPVARSLSAGPQCSPGARSDGWYQLGTSAPHRIRAEIARGLVREAAGDSLADVAFPVLTRLASDDHPHVRVNALRSIATYDERGRALLELAASDPDLSVRRVATEALDTTTRTTTPADTSERRVPPQQTRSLESYQELVDEIVAPALEGRAPSVVLHTARGAIELELFGANAPLTVHNFLSLARRGYYDGLVFHRVVPNFVAQDGDPTGSGMGGPGYSIRDELNPWRYERGVLGMALSGPDTGGSQYFITHSPQPHLDGGYTVFGRVRSGFEALDLIVQGDRIDRVEVGSPETPGK